MRTPITICLLLLTLFAVGQVKFQNKTVQPALKVKKDQTFLVSILHSKTKSDSKKPPEGGSIRYEALVTVIDSTEDEFTFRWRYQPSKSAEASPEAQAMMTLIGGLDLIYKTDGTGGFKELVNWEAVRDHYLRIVEASIPKKEGDSTNENLEKVKAMFSTKAVVQSAFIKEIQLLHSLYGQVYSTRLEKSSTFMTLPISEEPVPAMVAAQVTEMKPISYTVKTSQNIDKAGALKVFEQMFRKMGLTDDKQLLEAKNALTSFQMSDTGSYTMSTKTGLPIKAIYKRVGGGAGVAQTEVYELTVK